MFCVLVKAYSISPVCLQHTMQKALLLLFLSLLITYLATLSLEKEIIVLEKSLEKFLNFGSKNLYGKIGDSDQCIERFHSRDQHL